MKAKEHAVTMTLANAVVKATIITGVLDALAAILVYGFFYHYNPVQVYQFVASGLLGNEAYAGGLLAALLGLLIHFSIALISSFLFIWLYQVAPPLRQANIVLTGLLYGLVVWAFMNLVVIPLSGIPLAGFDIVTILAIIWHMAFVGLPIAFIASLYNKNKSRQ